MRLEPTRWYGGGGSSRISAGLRQACIGGTLEELGEAMGKGEGVATPMRPLSIYRLGAGEGVQNPPRAGHIGEIPLNLEITSCL